MNNRQAQILSELYRSHQQHTSESLAHLFGVSERTIRNDIHDINYELKEYAAQIEREGSKVMSLKIENEQLFKEFMQKFLYEDRLLPTEPEDRVHYLIQKFLLHPDYLKMDDIAEELYVSRSTILKDLRDVKVVLNKFNLRFEKRPNYGVALIGSEKHIRNAISELLFNRDQFMDFGVIKKDWLIEEEKMEQIKNVILSNIKKFNLNLSDIALNNLMIHITIAYKRVLANQYALITEKDLSNLDNKKEYAVARHILRDIESLFKIKFPEIEIVYVTMHLLGTKLVLNSDHAESISAIDSEINTVVMKIIDVVDRRLNLGIREDKELALGIALHLKPAIHRFRYRMNLRNPMLEAIKENYQLAFEAAVISSKIIETELRVKINEDEIGYIALHFGGAIERAKMKIKPLRALIVCATGIGSSQLLLYKIRSNFSHKLSVLEATELHNLPRYRDEDLDLIISTVPLPDSVTIPHIVVQDILGDGDMKMISKMIDQHNQMRSDSYLKPELVFAQKDFKTVQETIEYMCDKVWLHKYVDEDITSSVLEREEISPTAFGNLVAIPHPLLPVTEETFWTVLTLKKPIQWAGKPVQLVILLNVAKELTISLENMYQKLLAIIDQHEVVTQLIAIDDRALLFETIRKLINEL